MLRLLRQSRKKLFSWKTLFGILLVCSILGGQTRALDDTSKDIFVWQQFLWLLNIVWVLCAELAGFFLSNAWVYGEGIGFDQYLWELRTVSRNLANFVLLAIFLAMIFRALTKGGNGFLWDILKKVGKLLVAGVLIQASWFLIGATLDLEKILTTTASALPGLVIQSDSDFSENLLGFFRGSGGNFVQRKFDARLEDGDMAGGTIQASSDDPLILVQDQVLDSVLPWSENFAGPLFFLGGVMLDLGSLSAENITTSGDTNADTRIVFLFYLLIVAGYTIVMILLAIAGFLRIFVLRMWIALAPFLILLLVFKNDDLLKGMKLTEKFSLSLFLRLVFLPTIVVLGLGLILIMTVLLSGLMLESGSSFQDFMNFFQQDVRGVEFFVEAGKLSFGFLVLSLLIVALLWNLLMIVMRSFKAAPLIGDWIDKTVNKILKDMPIVPVPGANQLSAQNATQSALADTFWLSRQQLRQPFAPEQDLFSSNSPALMRQSFVQQNPANRNQAEIRRFRSLLANEPRTDAASFWGQNWPTVQRAMQRDPAGFHQKFQRIFGTWNYNDEVLTQEQLFNAIVSKI